MEMSSNGVGVLAVCAVSWSVALLALQLHKRLLSDFMKKIDTELHGGERYNHHRTFKVKKVRFAEDVVEPSSDNKEYRRRGRKRSHDKGGGTRSSACASTDDGHRSLVESPRPERDGERRLQSNSDREDEDNVSSNMPLNRQVLYKGIIEHKMLKASNNLPRHFY